MTVRAALRTALADTYNQSWRLVIVNTTLTVGVALVVLFVSAFPLVVLVAPLITGPLVAALVYCVVKLLREGDLELRDAVDGLRRHWRRGFALGALSGAVLLLGVLGISFYASERHRVLPLAVLAVYVIALAVLIVVVAWLLAIADPESDIVAALRGAFMVALQSPLRLLTLGAVLLLVNLVGAVTVVPLLTLTIAYSFLATARLVLPPEEVTA
ncbi:MAG: hypothetical protein ACJ734_05420 [Gaiellaceae bacterium]